MERNFFMHWRTWKKLFIPLAGGLVTILTILSPAPNGLPDAGWRIVGLVAFMAALWISEAIPFAATALLPLVLLPTLGVCDIATAAIPYANPVIFLFLGGMFLAQGMERCELHNRLAARLLLIAGDRQSAIIAGFLLSSTLLSMWINNTAVTLMMLPIAVSSIRLVRGGCEKKLAAALVLSVAYGSTIGGMATLVGTPSNALMAGFMQESYGIEIGFLDWMAISMPVVLVLLALAWLVLTTLAGKTSDKKVVFDTTAHPDIKTTPPIGTWCVTTVFFLTAMLWIARGFLNEHLPWLSDAWIAMTGGLALFFLPSGPARGDRVLNAHSLKQMPFDVLLLIGGGLSLAAAIQSSGLAGWIGSFSSHIGHLPPSTVLTLVLIVAIALAELTSNTATTAAFLPVVGALAAGLGHSPLLLGMGMTLAGSCGFMLPVSTPPNALIYACGHISLGQMIRTGFILNIGAWIILSTWFGWIAPRIFKL